MSFLEGGEQARNVAAAVARRSYGKLVAFLAAHTRDVAAAEDALAEAFAAALAHWPADGARPTRRPGAHGGAAKKHRHGARAAAR